MHKIIQKIPGKRNLGFTVVELLIVIGIIGILATITYLTYSGWRESTVATQMKNDLSNAATAMENEKNFSSGYPSTLPSNFTISDGISLNLAVAKTSEYCIEASSSTFSDLHYYITQDMAKTGAEIGMCPTTYSQIALGESHSCAIGSNGLAYCWGYNTWGSLGNLSTSDSQTPVAVNTSGVLSGKTIKSISAGSNFTCAIASDDQAYCWGYGSNGQLGNNSTTNSSVPVAVNTSGVLSGKTIKSISAGSNFTCAIASDDQAYCWGFNNYGQLGNNSTTNSSVPVAVDTSGVLSGKTIKSISAGVSSVCVVASDNQAYCWGFNNYGQLGNNSTTNSSVPVAVDTSGVLSGKTMQSIASGYMDTCSVDSVGVAYCWGYGYYGTLGRNSTSNSSVPVAVDTSGVLSGKTIKSISSGYYHTCVIASDNQVYCWGQNSSGQVGVSDSTQRVLTPIAVTMSGVMSGKTINSISAKYNHTCVIASDNQAYCWGLNSRNSLAIPGVNYYVPQKVDDTGALNNKTVNSISVGGSHTCAIASDGQAYCWGLNNYGQIGDNSLNNSTYPKSIYISGVLSGKTIKYITTGNYHTCAIASDDQAYCWGTNSGTLGDGTATQRMLPVAVDTSGALSGKTLKSISAGNNHTCAIASDNQAYCWGNNSNGQLGNNSTTQSLVPVAVDTSGLLSNKTIKYIYAGYSYTCAIASDDQAYCWGSNSYGQLGNNSTTQSLVPVAVDTSGLLSGLTIKSMALGNFHTCAIASNGNGYCWGMNAGYGSGSWHANSSIPVAVYMAGILSGKTLKSITAGTYFVCAIASDDKAYCWGQNENGQLGNNTTTTSYMPVAVSTSGSFTDKTLNNISTYGNSYHVCAIASDNKAYCWGNSSSGQLGYPGYYSYPMATSALP